MRRKFLSFFFVLVSLSAFAQRSTTYPQMPVPTELQDILLSLPDFPSGTVFQKTNLSRDPINGGWDTKKSFNPSDIVQGRLDLWKYGDLGFITKYGYLDNNSSSQNAAYSSIYYAAYPLEYNRRQGSFSGEVFGDASYYWDISFERVNLTSGNQKAGLSFSKGRFAFLVFGFSRVSPVDKVFLEAIARKAEKKIIFGICFADLNSALKTQIQNIGILHSLQVKLDHCVENYRQSDYKVALNNINSFENELNAQRGKAIPESGYQILKSLGDSIVNSLQFLISK